MVTAVKNKYNSLGWPCPAGGGAFHVERGPNKNGAEGVWWVVVSTEVIGGGRSWSGCLGPVSDP